MYVLRSVKKRPIDKDMLSRNIVVFQRNEQTENQTHTHKIPLTSKEIYV